MNGGALLARLGAVCLLLLTSGYDAHDTDAGTARAAEQYWPASQLDVRPQVKTHVMPEYPTELVSGIRGRVVLVLYISAKGAVDRVAIARAEPPGRFDQSAVKAFKSARFAPGMRKGRAVPSQLRIEVTFGD